MRNPYINGLKYELPHPFRAEAELLRGQFDREAYVKGGIVRWKSNNRIPPQDVLEFWRHLGKAFDYNKSLQALAKETEETLVAYRKRMANHEPSEEQLFEMRVAFGEGTEVVNLITGKKRRV